MLYKIIHKLAVSLGTAIGTVEGMIEFYQEAPADQRSVVHYMAIIAVTITILVISLIGLIVTEI